MSLRTTLSRATPAEIKQIIPRRVKAFLNPPTKSRRQSNRWLAQHAAEISGQILSIGSGSDLDGEGTREYIRVLRLLEKHDLSSVGEAVEQGLAIHAHSRDAIAQFLFPREDWRLGTLSLDGREHLRAVRVDTADVGAYNELLACAGGDR